MKKLYFLLLGLFLFNAMDAQIINFQDDDFKNELLTASTNIQIAKDINGNAIVIDSNANGEIEVSEALQVVTLFLYSNTAINDLTGISNFTNLKFLYAYQISVNDVDLTALSNLKELELLSSNVHNLNVTGLSNLEQLTLYYNQLQHLDVSGLVHLDQLYCSSNQILDLDLSPLASIRLLDCGNNSLTALDLSGLTTLTSVSCANNHMQSIILSGLVNLYSLTCSQNQLTTINTSGLNNLVYLYCRANLITSLDLSGLNNMEYLYCHYNQLTSLEVSNLSNLVELYCNNNQLTSLNVNGLSHLASLQTDSNNLNAMYIKDIAYPAGGEFDVMTFSNNPQLALICTNDDKISLYQGLANSYGYVNCAVTSDCALNSHQNQVEQDISIYPNPAAAVLNINAKNQNKISLIHIYNVLGQLVLVIPNAQKISSVDVSSLKTGNYFIKIISDKGSSNAKFIKE